MYPTEKLVAETLELMETKVTEWTIVYETYNKTIEYLRYEAAGFWLCIDGDGDLVLRGHSPKKGELYHHKVDNLSWGQRRKLRKAYRQLINEKVKRALDSKE